MAKGAEAKANVTAMIAKAFGEDYIGEYDKKLYVWSHENGEKVQVSIALACPKNPVGDVSAFADDEESGDLDFENMPPKPQAYTPAEVTAEEQERIADLLNRLGL